MLKKVDLRLKLSLNFNHEAFSIYSPVFYIATFGIVDDFYQSTHFIVDIIIVSIQKDKWR
ncbi:hypothetical protein ABF86_06615 [Nitrosomonas sp. GH22]|nr:hypothetical protein [Nitrosomonas sp. GH22]